MYCTKITLKQFRGNKIEKTSILLHSSASLTEARLQFLPPPQAKNPV